jgi:hypothetical protein
LSNRAPLSLDRFPQARILLSGRHLVLSGDSLLLPMLRAWVLLRVQRLWSLLGVRGTLRGRGGILHDRIRMSFGLSRVVARFDGLIVGPTMQFLDRRQRGRGLTRRLGSGSRGSGIANAAADDPTLGPQRFGLAPPDGSGHGDQASDGPPTRALPTAT